MRPLPVLAEPRPIERRVEVSLPAAVAAATGGFLSASPHSCWSACFGGARPTSLRLGGGRGRGKKVDVVGTRSFLVDIHLLKDR